jgi:hypothetical protein
MARRGGLATLLYQPPTWLAQKETVHPVFGPSLGSGKVRRPLSLLPRNAQGPHHIVKHDPLHKPIACNGRKLSD